MFAVGFVLVSPQAVQAQCTGQTFFNAAGRRYFRCTNALTFAAAAAQCATYTEGGGPPYALASSNSAAENAVLTANLGGASRWIGGSDQAAEGTWRWPDGTQFPPGIVGPYSNWNGGEPNNASAGFTCGLINCGNSGEDCTEMLVGGAWNDIPCVPQVTSCTFGFCDGASGAPTRGFICEGLPACGNGVIAGGEACDDGDVDSGDGCSSTCTIEAGYVCNGAPSVCTAVCAATPTVTRFGGRIYEFCNGPGTKTWANADAYCQQVSGRRLARIETALEHQHIIENIGGVDTWIGGQESGGNWVWRDGTNAAFYNVAGAASTLYTRWDNGEPNSGAGSGQCALIATGQDNRWDDQPCGNNRAFICERTDAAATSCGNSVVSGAETCDDGGTTSGDGCSSACQVERGFYCSPAGGTCTAVCTVPGTYFSRFPMSVPQLTTETTAEATAATNEYVRCANPRNAFHADRVCQSFGANWRLADVNSTFENTLIAGQITATSWIGATDEENGAVAGNEEGTFLWRDGSALAFTSWNGGEPNNAGNGEDCATTTNGGGIWNDLACSTAQPFVCEGPSFCGNGAVAMPEECDDANANNADSCLNNCTVRFGHACLLPGGNGDAAPVVAACPRGASCCYANAQSVIGDVRVVGGELEWSTVAEAGTLGFAVSVERGGEWIPLHDGVLPALPEAGQGAVYRLRASGLRGKTIRIEEYELRGRSLTVYEGAPRSTSGASTLAGREFAVTANALTGRPEMAIDAAPSAAALVKAAGDEPTGVFALADGDGLLRVTFAEIAAALQVPEATVASRVAAGELSVREHGNSVAWTRAADEPTAVVFAARRRESVYSATRPYEIRLTAGQQLVTVDRGMDDTATGEAQLRFHHEVDSFPALAVSPDPTQEFWFERSLGNHVSYQDYPATFTLENVDGQAATFDLSYYAAPGLSDENVLTLTMTINGQPAGAVDVSSTGLGVARFTIPAGALLAGPNTVQVRATSALPAGQALAYVDAYQVTYGAPLEFGAEGRFEAVTDGALAFELDNADGSPVWIVDVTSGERISATRTAIDATRARFTIDAQDNHEYFVASEAGLMDPAGLRSRSEQHFSDSSRAADYVVIAPAALYDAATALVARRQTQGLTAAVVDVQDIYDAYGAGEHNPFAIREFLRVAQTNWSTAPRYVLLLGDGNYDYRGVRPTGSGTIPPMMLRTDTGVYASDLALADTDGDGRPNLAIGRVPAHTALEADAFVQRVVTYESTDLDAFERHALLVSGGNRELDFSGYVNALESQLDSRVNAERIDRAQLTLAEARTQLINGINTGSFWFHYQGHGASNQLDDDGLLTLADVGGLTNANALTIFTGMSCSTARFEVPGMDSISELMLNGSPGGAIALFGPSGAGRSYESGNIADAFQRGLLTGNNLTDGRVGDVVLGLYHPTTGANATTAQLGIYLLLGDPATQLPDRSRLAPPVVVDPPDEDGGVTEPMVDGGRADSGRPRPEPPGPVTPPGGALGGGACTVSVTSRADTTSGLLLLLGLLAGLGRRARRRAR